jgi:hypothetical protein
MKMKRFLVLLALVLALLTNGIESAAAATETATVREAPTTGESWAAAVAVVGAIGISAGILWLVNRAHAVQQSLAQSVVRRGGTAQVVVETASGRENVAVDDIVITGPDQVQVNTAGEFNVPDTTADPEWSVSGISAYARGLKGPRTLVFTPHEPQDGVEISVRSGARTGRTAVAVLPANPPLPFALRLAVRSWGLVLVAVVVVFGAVALGLTGHLDGANFVALVAPLAALLGVTAAASGRSGDEGDTGAKP